MDVKGGKDIGIKKVMWDVQAAQHSGQYPAAAKGHHMYCSCTDLYSLKGFCGEAPAAVRQSLQNYHPFTPLQQLCGAEQAAQSSADYYRVVCLFSHEPNLV